MLLLRAVPQVMGLYKCGLMHKNNTHLVTPSAEGGKQTKLLEKSHIHEAELTLDPKIQVCALT